MKTLITWILLCLTQCSLPEASRNAFKQNTGGSFEIYVAGSWRDETLAALRLMVTEKVISSDSVINIAFGTFHFTDVGDVLVNEVSPEWAKITSQTIQEILSIVAETNAHVVLSFAGWPETVVDVLTSFSQARTLAGQLADFVDQHHLHGVSFDLEDPEAVPEQAHYWAYMMYKLKQQLPPGSIISMTVAGGESLTPMQTSFTGKLISYVEKKYPGAIDYYNMMEYDMGKATTPVSMIEKDIMRFNTAWNIPYSRMRLGFCVVPDAAGMTLNAAELEEIVRWTIEQKMVGTFIWTGNLDYQGRWPSDPTPLSFSKTILTTQR